MQSKSLCSVGGGGVYISGTEYRKLKFSVLTHLTSVNASVNLDNVDVLYLEDGNVYRPVLNTINDEKQW